jgi:cytochrome c oxidase subunit 2
MTQVLIIVAVVLVVAAVVQVVRIMELTSELRGGNTNAVTDKDNRNQAMLMFLFMVGMMGSFLWMWAKWDHLMLPGASSEHGVQIDNLMAITMGIIIIVFFITQPLLFWFAYRYRGKEGNTASYVSHNNKLELVWTAIPAIVLTVLIVYGLKTWSGIVNKDTSDAQVVEFYARQFDWTARYTGEDGILGEANVRNIEGANIVGVNMEDEFGQDDFIGRGEIVLPVNQPMLFKFRSQDVLHSAYFPHFRVQMNCVPGMNTQFAFTPTKTTEQMRQETSNPEFDYILLCNKICGAAHYNMQMTIKVVSQDEYDRWLSEQTPLANS